MRTKFKISTEQPSFLVAKSSTIKTFLASKAFSDFSGENFGHCCWYITTLADELFRAAERLHLQQHNLKK